ncbi:MAG: hypothetical protein K6B46_03480 [Opitutales bacterium]|nr:hypothetical protein [Opitutales bacterium]
MKLISILAMALVAIPAFATSVGEGSSAVVSGPDGQPIVLAAGEEIPAGAAISTEDEKKAAIKLDNGSVVVLSAGATATVNGNVVEVVSGNVVLSATAPVVVRTPHGSFSTSNGSASITNRGSSTQLTSATGVWRSESFTGTVRGVGEGQTVEIGGDGAAAVRNASENEVAQVNTTVANEVAVANGETPASESPAEAAVPSTTPETDDGTYNADIPEDIPAASGEAE